MNCQLYFIKDLVELPILTQIKIVNRVLRIKEFQIKLIKTDKANKQGLLYYNKKLIKHTNLALQLSLHKFIKVNILSIICVYYSQYK